MKTHTAPELMHLWKLDWNATIERIRYLVDAGKMEAVTVQGTGASWTEFRRTPNQKDPYAN